MSVSCCDYECTKTLVKGGHKSFTGLFMTQHSSGSGFWQLGDITGLQPSKPAYAATIFSKNCPHITALEVAIVGSEQVKLTCVQ